MTKRKIPHPYMMDIIPELYEEKPKRENYIIVPQDPPETEEYKKDKA